MNHKPILSRTPVVVALAVLCNVLWGSAIPFINLGYKLFEIPSGDTQTQILFAGVRFFLAGFLTILFASVPKKALVRVRKENFPVGLDGEQRIKALVCGVMAASSWAGVILKSCSMPAWMMTGVASAIFTISG